jgi:enoyl-CoA hydratase
MTPDIRFERRGRLGVVVLDRQRALNALTWDMIRALSTRLAAWREDAQLAAVLVKAAPGRAFCAGGDIRAVSSLARHDGVRAATGFFRDEYRLNWRIHSFPKPYIALLDDITMGGGAGISVHGGYRVVTENTRFAMPETGIGFFPDVGATWFLPRCPGEVGMYLGLTGARLDAADCLTVGLATDAAAAMDLDRLEARLQERLEHEDPAAAVSATLGEFRQNPGASRLQQLRPDIDRHFAGVDLAAILASLHADSGGFAVAQLRELATKSPLALHLTCTQLRRGNELGIEDALRLEYRMVHRVLAGHDFHEGVRALLIDKNRRPQWRDHQADAIAAAVVAAAMSPLPSGELDLDWQGT